MPTYPYISEPRPLTQAELDALAAEQAAMGGAVPNGGYHAVPPPPASSYATEPIGGNDTITGYSAGYGAPSVGQGSGYGVAGPLSHAAPYIPEPAQPVGSTVVPSEVYGGSDPAAPRITTGLVETMHPASGAPATSRIVPSGPRAAQDQRRAGQTIAFASTLRGGLLAQRAPWTEYRDPSYVMLRAEHHFRGITGTGRPLTVRVALRSSHRSAAIADGVLTAIAIAELPPLTVIPGFGPFVTLAGGSFPG